MLVDHPHTLPVRACTTYTACGVGSYSVAGQSCTRTCGPTTVPTPCPVMPCHAALTATVFSIELVCCCTVCPVNTFASSMGTATCTPCAPGSDTSGAIGSTSSAACVPCAPGNFSTGTGGTCTGALSGQTGHCAVRHSVALCPDRSPNCCWCVTQPARPTLLARRATTRAAACAHCARPAPIRAALPAAPTSASASVRF